MDSTKIILYNIDMKNKIIINPNAEEANEIREAIKANDGYCCCATEHTPDTKCMCRDFRENIKSGWCHCGLYCKLLDWSESKHE